MTKKILFPTDYSPASNAALRSAISLARQSNADLLIVHVEPTWTRSAGTVPPPSEDRQPEEDALVTLLTTVNRNSERPVQHEFRTLRGDPATEIVQLAQKEQAELIVMATAGRTGLRRLLMGSVAEAVARNAPCPVLSLHEPLSEPIEADKFPAQAGESNPAQSPAVAGQNVTVAVQPQTGHPAAAIELLERALAARATDVHIDPLGDDMEVRFRIDGRLEHFCRLGREVGRPIISQIKIISEMDIADPFHPHEGRMALPEPLESHEVRVTSMPVLGGESVALRLFNRQRLLRPLDTLGLTAESLAALDEMLELGEGLILVTGPAGSGKTTTAYSMVQTLDRGDRNIVTIEDPPEYHVDRFHQVAVDARHGVTMTSGLRSLLRMDPDVVLIGEIRDAETAEIAMRAASSGRYVFSTLHTRDVASTVTALRDLHIDNRSLAGNLTGLISQRLVRRLCPACHKPAPLAAAVADKFAREGVEPPAQLLVAAGCENCRHRGYLERIGIFEVVIPNRPIREAIEQGAPEHELRELIRSRGVRSLVGDGLVKVRDGVTSLDEVSSMTWGHLLQ